MECSFDAVFPHTTALWACGHQLFSPFNSVLVTVCSATSLKEDWSLCGWNSRTSCAFPLFFLGFSSEFIPHSCITCQKISKLVFHLNPSVFRTAAFLCLLDIKHFFLFMFVKVVQACFLLLQCGDCLCTDCHSEQWTVGQQRSLGQTWGRSPVMESLHSFFK